MYRSGQCYQYICMYLVLLSSSRTTFTRCDWSLMEEGSGARTIEETTVIANSHRKKFNVSRLPIFPMILLTRVVVDNYICFYMSGIP